MRRVLEESGWNEGLIHTSEKQNCKDLHKNLYASAETLLVVFPHINVYFENMFNFGYHIFKYLKKK